MRRTLPDHAGLMLFSELLEIPSPSGHEAQMAGFLAERLAKMGCTPEVDPAGNVMVRIDGESGDRPVHCIAAHIDEIGLVVTGIESGGTIRVDRLGGLLPWKLGETPVEILGDLGTTIGVVSMGSGHSRTESRRAPDWSEVLVWTGLSKTQLEAKGIRIGSTAVPVRDVRGPFVFGDPRDPWIAAWSFDNRLGVATLLQSLGKLLREGITPRSPMVIAFTVEEEVGGHGAKALAQRERLDVFVAIDGSPLVPECPLELDGRPGIRSQDRAAQYDQRLLAEIRRIAAEAGVELQPVVYPDAASDASLVYSVGACPRVACLGYVRGSSHGFEVAPLVTFDRMESVLTALISQL